MKKIRDGNWEIFIVVVLLNRLSASQHGQRSIAISVHNRKQSVPKRVSAARLPITQPGGDEARRYGVSVLTVVPLIAARASIIAAPVGVDLRRSTWPTENPPAGDPLPLNQQRTEALC